MRKKIPFEETMRQARAIAADETKNVNVKDDSTIIILSNHFINSLKPLLLANTFVTLIMRNKDDGQYLILKDKEEDYKELQELLEKVKPQLVSPAVPDSSAAS